MPDDMLEDAISVAKKALEEHDFEEQGVEVRYFSFIFWALCKRLIKLFRLQESLRNTWTTTGNLTGMCSLASSLAATPFTNVTVLSTSALRRAKYRS